MNSSRIYFESVRDMIAQVSHDIKTPVAAIKGFTETLINGAIYDQKNRVRFLKTIEKHAKELENLLEHLLTLSAFESGGLNFDCEPVHLRSYVHEFVESVEPLTCERRVSVTTNIEPDLFLFIDKVQLNRILQNLISNAIKYNSIGGRIEIEAFQIKNDIFISVRDSGKGISKKKLPHIFERLYALKEAPRNAGYSGLGLHITKKIVEALSGRIWVQSEEGEGTIFTLSLPVDTTNGYIGHRKSGGTLTRTDQLDYGIRRKI